MSNSFSDMIVDGVVRGIKKLLLVLVIGWLLATGLSLTIICLYLKGYIG